MRSAPSRAMPSLRRSLRDTKPALCTSFPYRPKIARLATARGLTQLLDARHLPKTSAPNLLQWPDFRRLLPVRQVTKGVQEGSPTGRNYAVVNLSHVTFFRNTHQSKMTLT